MLVKAIYKETKQECYVNDAYVIDVFYNEKQNLYEFYTFDNDRGCYLVEPEEFKKVLISQDVQNVKLLRWYHGFTLWQEFEDDLNKYSMSFVDNFGFH